MRHKNDIFTPINRDLYYLLSNSMEDFILREIDRLGEMLLIVARKLGLQEDVMPDYSLFRPQRRQEGGNPTRCSFISGR